MPRFTPPHVRLAGATLAAALVLPLLLPAAAGAQAYPTELVVFGDSLSDPGNGFAFVKDNATPPDYGMGPLLVPDAPYAIGGHHLTNGATWIEQLAPSIGLGRNALPAFASANPHALNFAIGTARARQTMAHPSLALEVAAYLQKTGGVARADALYVIQIGGNDVRDALNAGSAAAADAILQDAAVAIRTQVAVLYQLGARNFLVWTVPNVGLTPAIRSLGPIAVAGAASATAGFNGYLTLALQGLVLPGATIVGFDANAVITSIVTDPIAYGFTDVTSACVTPTEPPFRCRAADQYLFWDGIHPTKAAHAVIARAVAQLLGFTY